MISLCEKTYAGLKMQMVKLTDIKPHPLNAELYPNDNLDDLLKDMTEHFNENGYPNIEPVKFCRNTGILFSGNSRYLAALMIDGCNWISAVYAHEEYNERNSDHVQLQILSKYNPTKTMRDTQKPTICVPAFLKMTEAFEAEFGPSGKDNEGLTLSKFKNKLWANFGVLPADGRKYILIYEYSQDLLKRVDDRADSMTLNRAHTLAKGGKPENPIDDDRFNFYKWFDENPTFLDTALKNSIGSVKLFDPIMHDEINGHEINFISTAVSNAYNSYFCKTFNDFGLTARTSKFNTGHPDIQFEDLSKESYDMTKIEIKTASFGASAKDTYFYGGPGVKKDNPHEILFVVWSDECKEFWVCICTVSPDIWRPSGGKYVVSVSDLFMNKQNNNLRMIAGSAFITHKKKVELKWSTVNDD